MAGFLTAIYSDALGRAVDSVGSAAFTLALKSGATDAQVATAIFGSTEYLDDDVNGYYIAFLRRPADPSGLNNWVTSIQQPLQFWLRSLYVPMRKCHARV